MAASERAAHIGDAAVDECWHPVSCGVDVGTPEMVGTLRGSRVGDLPCKLLNFAEP